jgi:UDP-N-acetylmuramate dehydrogenase
MKIEHNKNLKNYNTFHINQICDNFITIEDEKELKKLKLSNDFFILGGGSNILISRKLNQVIFFSTDRINIISQDENKALVSAEAGVKWDNFVKFCIEKNLSGAENLSLIPGTVGAAPIQNIGAYGVEVADIVYKVRFWNIEKNKFEEIDNKSCKFDYRNSIFKNELKGKIIITKVFFELSKKTKLKLNYGGLNKIVEQIENPTIADVREAVIKIRKSKLPDTEMLGNSGSFFKNAIVKETKLCELAAKYPDLKYFKASGGYKIPTAWLIEKAGLKGFKHNKCGVYEKHALILVNFGEASANDILNLANFIEKKIFDKFGIKIYKEVNIV